MDVNFFQAISGVKGRDMLSRLPMGDQIKVVHWLNPDALNFSRQQKLTSHRISQKTFAVTSTDSRFKYLETNQIIRFRVCHFIHKMTRFRDVSFMVVLLED